MELEFKIIRSQTPLFASADKMHEILKQEAKAGWQLLEKTDNYHIKLQRDIGHRANDANLDFDVYRSVVGVSPLVTYGATAAVTLLIVSVILYLAIWNQG